MNKTRNIATLLVTVYVFAVASTDLLAQCAPFAAHGNIVGNFTRLQDIGNLCACNTVPGAPHLLHLLHSNQPSLRLSSNPQGTCAGEVHATISLYRGTVQYSTLEGMNDFSLVADATANDLILSTRDSLGAIRFATTTPILLQGNGQDHERMTITNIGHVGIGNIAPKELVHVGAKMTFHVGYENDYLGYNVYRWSNGQVPPTTEDRLIVGTSTTDPGYPLKYGMTRQGVIEIAAGTTLTGATDEPVDWWEGGTAFAGFAGMTMKNYGGLACTSFGRYWPDEHTRVLIQAPYESDACTSDCESALRIITWNNEQLFCVREGNVIVGTKQCTTTVSTSNFNVRMSVDGIIFANELIITLDNWQQEWPDYVLAPDYQLMPLDRVKSFIGENGHLPGMPSASEVATEGIEMRTMQAQLLKKIEELTLHVIRLHEQNAELQEEVATLKRR